MKKVYILVFALIINLSAMPFGVAYANDAPFLLLDDTEAKLSDYQGKPLLIDTMATWCEPCKIEMAHLYEVQRVASDNVTIVSISISPATDGISDMIKFKEDEEKIQGLLFNWDFGIDVDEIIIAKFNVTVIPTLILLDQDGELIKRWAGVTPTEEILKEIDENIEYTPPGGNLLLDSLLNNMVFQITVGLFVIAIVYFKLVPKKLVG